MDEFSLNNLTDEEIIAEYKAGDEKKLKELIARYTTSLYNFALRLGAKNEAEDVVQEIFIKVWKNLGKFDQNKAKFKTWVFTIAKNTITDHLRKKKNILFTDISSSEPDGTTFEENIEDTIPLPDEALEKLEDSEFLNTILDKLPENYREVLVLHYQEELTFDEIGKVLDKPLNTVKSWHYRAMKKLKENIVHQNNQNPV